MPLRRGRPPHHYGEQHGDLMRDPEMVFEMHTYAALDMAEPLSFRNEYMGLMQEVYRHDESGKKTHVNTKLKQKLTSFAKTWFTNLKSRGFSAMPPSGSGPPEPLPSLGRI